MSPGTAEEVADPFAPFSGAAAILLGLASIVYAIFYLLVGQRPGDFGRTAAAVTLAVGAFLGTAAYTGLYFRVCDVSHGFALWGLALGIAHQALTLAGSVYQAFLGAAAQSSQTDPRGVAAFLLFGVASAVFGWLVVQEPQLPRPLGYVGLVNALLLVLLFLGNATGSRALILAAGGLTSVIVTPLWWIWVGLQLRRPARGAQTEVAPQTSR